MIYMGIHYICICIIDIYKHTSHIFAYTDRGSLHLVIAKVLYFSLEVRKIEFQGSFTLRKGMALPYPSSYGLNSTTTVLLQGALWH